MDATVLTALAEPSRLRIVELLRTRPHTVGEIAGAADPTWAEGRALRIIRTLPAAPEVVWAHWTTPGLMAAWWAPDHFTVAECAIDPRPGGAMRLVMQEGDGTRHAAAGHVTRAAAPSALDFEMT